MMHVLRRSAVLSTLACFALIVGVVSWSSADRPRAPRVAVAASRTVPIATASLVCPQAGGKPSGGAARIAYADASDAVPADGDTLTANPLDSGSAPASLEVHPGHAWVVDGPAQRSPVLLAASGTLADSVAAMQFTRELVGSGAVQLSTAMCETPTTDAWFAGLSSQVGAHASLLLSNVDAEPAIVDVTVYGDDGSVGPPATELGIRVGPRSQAAVSLDALDPGVTTLVAHVAARIGRIAPAVRYDREGGEVPLGVAWVPRTAPPATSQTVPGLLPGDGARELVLANPGDLDATATIEIATPDGSFTPDGYDQILVPAGQVTTVDLQPVLGKQPALVRVSADEPVVAGAWSALSPSKVGASDIGFSAAVPSLAGPTLVPGGENQVGRHTWLALSAPDASARLRISVLPAAATDIGSQTVLDVAGGTTTVVDLAALTKDIAPAVVITPNGGGPLFAAWYLQEPGKAGDGLAEVPLHTPVRTFVVPPARAGLALVAK